MELCRPERCWSILITVFGATMSKHLESGKLGSLFEEFQLGGLKLPNRIVMAPMTRSRVASENQLGDLNAKYYAQRATARLIISEAIVVNPMGRGYLFIPGIYSSVQIKGARKVTDSVH